jgi:hypothetical protein
VLSIGSEVHINPPFLDNFHDFRPGFVIRFFDNPSVRTSCCAVPIMMNVLRPIPRNWWFGVHLFDGLPVSHDFAWPTFSTNDWSFVPLYCYGGFCVSIHTEPIQYGYFKPILSVSCPHPFAGRVDTHPDTLLLIYLSCPICWSIILNLMRNVLLLTHPCIKFFIPVSPTCCIAAKMFDRIGNSWDVIANLSFVSDQYDRNLSH